MSLTSYIQFGNNELKKYSRQYSLKYTRCHLSRADNNIRPTTDAVCESINIGVIVPEKDDRFVYEWYISGDMQSGRILIEISDPMKDNEPVWKEIFFEGATCFSMSEDFKLDTNRRSLDLGIVATHIVISDLKF